MVMAPLVMMPWVMMLETVVMVRMTKAGSGEADDGREDANDGAADRLVRLVTSICSFLS